MNRLLLVVSLVTLSACSITPDQAETPVSRTAEFHAHEGHRLAETNRIADAMVELDRALQLDPKQPLALRDRAILLHAAGRQAEALADIDAAVALRPDDVRTVGARCVIRVAAERSDAGLADCERALALPGAKANAHVSLGQAQLALGRYDAAIAGFNDALSLHPNHMRALYGRGLARQAAGDAGGADDQAEALRRLPGAAREFWVPKAS